MRSDISRALAITPNSSARERTVDITTIGARTGRPRRIEIWFYRVDGEIYLTSTPARRSWYVNLLHHPRFTFHLKHGVRADLDALATPVDDQVRAHVFASVIDDLNQPSNPAGIPQPVEPFERWMADSPLLHVTFPEGGAR
ncbi:nitroreductase/quinone reductase family protein [Microbacterium stercoris]|uniref:Nitroreductase family deazaflavin-dependent oxidoreductase n=1 Tax=Microbacterium stercoris TaxID=2820289 RepID=A0A939QJQ1_9MICO|nr:nitroreductase/quinone reductase family protein [Microbacterium stercoris]MBO3664173.1 nitroreductase family deazaflavin-dependent oxidoreductase [Microbacterium stercoris]